MKILYAEDHPQMRRGLSQLFRDAGHEVIEAATVSQAAEELSRAEFDGIVCDGTLDKENRYDGIRFVQEQRAHGRRAVVLTMDVSEVPEGVPCVSKTDPDAVGTVLRKLSE